MRDTLGAGCARAASSAVTTASKRRATAARAHGPDGREAPLRAGVADQTRSAAHARWTLVIRVVPEPRSPGRPASETHPAEFWKNADVIRPGGPVRREPAAHRVFGAPGDDRVHKLVTTAVHEICGLKPDRPQHGGVVRDAQIRRHVRPCGGPRARVASCSSRTACSAQSHFSNPRAARICAVFSGGVKYVGHRRQFWPRRGRSSLDVMSPTRRARRWVAAVPHMAPFSSHPSSPA